VTESASLAVVLRQTQWLLADAARDVPAAKLTPERAEELATILDDLATLVRRNGEAVVIEGDAASAGGQRDTS
jgi:hypothetical protein